MGAWSLLHLLNMQLQAIIMKKQETGYHAITVQILTFWLVTLKVAHQFDVLFNVFEAFQFPIIVNNFHWVLNNL